MQSIGSAYWIDTKSKIEGSDTNCVEGILADASSYEEPPLVVFIVYDAPNRDCAANASNGEICCTYNDDGTCDYEAGGDCASGLQEYNDDYITPFAQVLAKYDGLVPIVLVIEPDTLPNLATNMDNPRCGDNATVTSYKTAVPLAVNTFAAQCPSCAIYGDAAHGGWLGWPSNLKAFVNIISELNIAPKLRGFTTNSANYQPLGITLHGNNSSVESYVLCVLILSDILSNY
jgi:cellulose 1,4-beta-cellobiosidase